VQDRLYRLFRRRGASRDVIAHVDPEDATYGGRLVHYGHLQQRLGFTFEAYQFFPAQFEIRGLI
jgi:hypothetical protein